MIFPYSQLLADKELGGWIKDASNADNDITAMVQKYITEIEEMRTKLLESENLCEQLRKETSRMKRMSQIRFVLSIIVTRRSGSTRNLGFGFWK